MKASIVDLRYRMKDVLEALNKGEKVTVLYHGKEKATIIPSGIIHRKNVEDHAFFNMESDSKKTVSQIMNELRGSRT